ncbi:MAG: hypothetical protein QM778_26055 [Myxococcales bacterium]
MLVIGSFPAYFGLEAQRFRGKTAAGDERKYSNSHAFLGSAHLPEETARGPEMTDIFVEPSTNLSSAS